MISNKQPNKKGNKFEIVYNIYKRRPMCCRSLIQSCACNYSNNTNGKSIKKISSVCVCEGGWNLWKSDCISEIEHLIEKIKCFVSLCSFVRRY